VRRRIAAEEPRRSLAGSATPGRMTLGRGARRRETAAHAPAAQGRAVATAPGA